MQFNVKGPLMNNEITKRVILQKMILIPVSLTLPLLIGLISTLKKEAYQVSTYLNRFIHTKRI